MKQCLSKEEADELEFVAKNLGLLREQVETVHRAYLRDLVQVALANGSLSFKEMSDLETISDLLVVSRSELSHMLKEKGFRQSEPSIQHSDPNSAPRALNGKSICFTGTFICEPLEGEGGRATAERLASEAGMIVKNGVTKSLDLLVAADVETMSTKAKKARQYRIAIESEAEFWQMMGIEIKTD